MRAGAGPAQLPWKGDEDEGEQRRAYHAHHGPGVCRALSTVVRHGLRCSEHAREECITRRDAVEAHLYAVVFAGSPSDTLATWTTVDKGHAASLVAKGMRIVHATASARQIGERMTMWLDGAALALARAHGVKLPLFQPEIAMAEALRSARRHEESKAISVPRYTVPEAAFSQGGGADNAGRVVVGLGAGGAGAGSGASSDVEGNTGTCALPNSTHL